MIYIIFIAFKHSRRSNHLSNISFFEVDFGYKEAKENTDKYQ
jgi:hypothetical protein